MKKLLSVVALSSLLAACGTAEDVTTEEVKNTEDKQTSTQSEQEVSEVAPLEGYVTRVEEPGRYVVAHYEPKNISESNEQFVDLLIVHSEETLEVGDYVKVWYDIVMTSYPGQTTATKIEKVEPTVKSTLSAKQVVQAVAEQFSYYPVITNVAYDEAKKRWTLQYKYLEAMSDEPLISMAIADEEPLTLGEPIYSTPPSLNLKLREHDQIGLYLQSYDWEYVDLATDTKKMAKETVEGVTFPSMSESYKVQMPEQVTVESSIQPLSVEILLLDEAKNVVKTVQDASDVPAGMYHIQVNATFEQGTATYVQTIGFE